MPISFASQRFFLPLMETDWRCWCRRRRRLTLAQGFEITRELSVESSHESPHIFEPEFKGTSFLLQAFRSTMKIRLHFNDIKSPSR